MLRKDTIGGFEVLSQRDRGGMGQVYEARDPRTGAWLALKVASDDPRSARSLRHEIRALRHLDHPGVVRMVAHGVDEGSPWLALEWLEPGPFPVRAGGTERTLADLGAGADVEAGSWTGALLPEREVRARVGELCRTLAWLHGEGVAHCDLKPGNILARGDGKPVLVDLGLWAHAHGSAPRFDALAHDRRALSRDTLDQLDIAGTLAYIAPETLAGQTVDARADLYAVGCILYELLTGVPPFLGAASWVASCHRSAIPEPPSSLDAGVDPALDRLVMRLLEKDPAARPAFAADVAAELLGTPVEAAPYVYRSSALVGRERERNLLGTGPGVALILGESGAGRTRLALELAREARAARTRTERIRFRDQAGEPLEAFADLLAGLPAPAGEGWPISALVPFFGSLAERADAHELPRLDPVAERERIFDSLDQVLARLHQSAPLLLILDDLHAADSLTVEFVAWLAERPCAYRVVGTLRSDADGPAIRALLASPAPQVELGPLADAQIRGLIARMLGAEDLPPDLVRPVIERARGNPLFVSESLHTAVARGLLRRSRGEWTARPGEVLPLPLSIRQILDDQMRALDPDSLRLAQSVAVVGSGWASHWSAALSELDEERLDRATAALVRARILHAEPGIARFRHEEARHAAYATLASSERLALHARFAAALESGGGRDAALAHHYAQADKRAVAQVHLLAAAQRAQAQGALEDAIRHYGWYVSAMDPDAAEGPSAASALAGLTLLVGRTTEALQPAARLEALHRRHGDAAGISSALALRATIHLHLGEHDTARTLLTEALEVLGPDAPPKARMMIAYRLWWLENNLGRHAEALARIDSAIAIAERGPLDPEEEIWLPRFRATRGQTLMYLGRTRDAVQALKLALAALRDQGESELHPVLGALALGQAQLGQPELARATMAAAIASARDNGATAGLINLLAAECYRCARDGETDTARAMADELQELEGVEGTRIGQLARAMAASSLAMNDGDLERAHEQLAIALEVQESTGIRAWSDTVALHQLVLLRRSGAPYAEVLALWEAAEAAWPAAEPDLRCALCCERGHLELAAGKPAQRWFDEAAASVAPLEVDRHHRSPSGRALQRLHRALHWDGERICGEHPSDLPGAT